MLALAVVGTGAGVFALGSRPSQPEAPKRADPEPKADEKVQARRQAAARLDLAKQAYEGYWVTFQLGRENEQTVNLWSRRWLQAQLDLSEKKADRDAALQAHLERLKRVDEVARARLDLGGSPRPPERAADAAAAALAEGMAPAAVSEAISLAANQLVLRDNGRPRDEGPNKPAGSVHGDSIGVHACDSANAWRNLARVANWRNRVVCLILGAWQVAHDRTSRGGDFLGWQPYPRDEAREQVRGLAPDRILAALEEAIRSRNQAAAAALVQGYGEANLAVRPLWDMLLRYAISEDGALHAEKFYRTVTEEFASTRAAFRWRHLIALARVTASAHGYPAPGHADACRLLGV